MKLKINKKTSDKNALGIILINKGNLKILQDSLFVAIDLLSKAYDLFLELGDLRRIAISFYNIAKVHSKVGGYADAIVKLDKLLNIYDKLFEICPNLSATEIKIATLLKLNLSTKEIAAITFKTESSIKTVRHRIRQKLKIGENDNLVAFLLRL